MRPTHRISYQCDEFAITTCGQRVLGSRKEITQHDWLTIWNHGEATCPICGDPAATMDTALLRETLQERFPGTVRPMIDLNTFRKEFCAGLLRVAAELDGMPVWEAERKYLTDPVFHAQVDTVVDVAVAVIRGRQEPGEDRMPELRELFHNEADEAWAAWPED